MRLLVFDDDAAVGRLVVRIATMSGVDAVAVADDEAFETHLRTDPPQVVVLDLQLGDTDGVEQMRLLADRQYTGSLVLMSGFDQRVLATARAVGQSLGLKLVGVLEKPLRVAELELILERLQLEGQPPSVERLLEAIVNDELVIDFQPIVRRKPKELRKLDALVRWEHPVSGRISPGAFLPIAESDTAAVDALTEWVVNAAIDAYLVLAELGVIVPLSVNISPLNLHDLTFPDRLEQRLLAGGMPARYLCLKITERAAFKDAARTMDILSRVRLKGMQLSIDDFGLGYSSLKLLRQMPASEIRIDQSFVSEVTTSRDCRAIVKSIIDLGTNMGMDCVAKGVETEATADLLEQLGVSDLQGYLIARPMPVEAVPAWLAIWTQTGRETPSDQASPAIHKPDVTARMEVPPPLPDPSAAAAESKTARLTPRQLEVLQALAEGGSVKEVARRLGIGIGTVKVHLSLAYSALGARNRIEAIRLAGPALLSGPIKQGTTT